LIWLWIGYGHSLFFGARDLVSVGGLDSRKEFTDRDGGGRDGSRAADEFGAQDWIHHFPPLDQTIFNRQLILIHPSISP
jgi:hypothetical protein